METTKEKVYKIRNFMGPVVFGYYVRYREKNKWPQWMRKLLYIWQEDSSTKSLCEKTLGISVEREE